MASQGNTNIKYEPGDFCHVELPVKDKARAKTFYGEVFGWKFQDVSEMDYTLFTTPGGVVGGGFFTPSKEMPDKVINYITVKSIEETAERVTKFGGKTLGPKMEIKGQGMMMHLADSEGNMIALWQQLK